MNNSPCHSFQLFSPFLKQQPSPILSPFPHLRKISDDFSDLAAFKLEPELLELEGADCDHHDYSQCGQVLNNDFVLDLGSQKNQQLTPLDEVNSPAHSNRCEMPSTRFHQPKEEQQPPFLLLSSENPEPSFENMIEFLVEHSQLREDVLFCEGKRFYELGQGVEEAFKILARKFRKLKKTKQELTKYCMRKAFKYVSQVGKREASGRGLEGSMRRYFAEEDNADSFSVPFKKNSAEKTMNGNFLRRVFGCPRFAADYRNFLNQFSEMMRQDNGRKVAYLAKLVSDAIHQNSVSSIEAMRRLPWTAQILTQTCQLATSLPQEANGRRQRRSQ